MLGDSLSFLLANGPTFEEPAYSDGVDRLGQRRPEGVRTLSPCEYPFIALMSSGSANGSSSEGFTALLLGVTPDRQLIFGQRRIEAFRLLGRCEIPATIIDLDDVLAGEWAENEHRKAFTVTERVSISQELYARVAAANKERQGTRTDLHCGKLPQGSGSKTREVAGKAVGLSGSTYIKAKVVTEAADRDPEKYGPIAAEMDRTGKVDPAYQKVLAERKQPARTADTVSIRDERIRQMAADSYRPSAIAQAVGLGESTIRTKLSEWGIPTVESKIGRGRPRMDANNVLSNLIENATPPVEAVAIGLAIEERERAKAAQRKAATQAHPGERVGGEKFSSPIFPGPTGKTVDIVGHAIGLSGPTYSRAKAVVLAAEENPETFGPLKEEMDRTGKVTRAYEALRKAKATVPRQFSKGHGVRPSAFVSTYTSWPFRDRCSSLASWASCACSSLGIRRVTRISFGFSTIPPLCRTLTPSRNTDRFLREGGTARSS